MSVENDFYGLGHNLNVTEKSTKKKQQLLLNNMKVLSM